MNVVDKEYPAKIPKGHQVYQLSLKSSKGPHPEMQNSKRHRQLLRCLHLGQNSKGMRVWRSAMLSTLTKFLGHLDRLIKIRCLACGMEPKLSHP